MVLRFLAFAVIIIGRMLREKQRIGLKTPVLKVRCVVGDQEHLEDLLATETYIKVRLVQPGAGRSLMFTIGKNVIFFCGASLLRMIFRESPLWVPVCLQEELNACELELSSDCSEVPLSLTLNFKVLGPRVGRAVKTLQEEVKKLSQRQLMNFEAEGKLEVAGFVLSADDATLRRELAGASNPNIAVHGDR